MSQLVRVIIAFVVWFYLSEFAVTYGGIWQSQSNPTQNVQVQLQNGAAEIGSLQQTWSRDWVLLKKDGSISNLKDLSYVALSFPMPSEPPSFWALWRSWLPLTLVSGATILFILFTGLLPFINRKRNLWLTQVTNFNKQREVND